jgi:hypothetical protein
MENFPKKWRFSRLFREKGLKITDNGTGVPEIFRGPETG